MSLGAGDAHAQARGGVEPRASRASGDPVETVRFTPYALLATSFYWNSAPLASADAPSSALGGESAAFGATTRQSRIGLRMEAPSIATVIAADAFAAVAEVDFFGGYYAGNDTTYFMPHIRLRLLSLSATYGPLSLVVGQDAMVLAPLNPFSLTHVAVAGFQGAGNPWARIPQLRAELRLGQLSLAAAVLAPAGAGAVEASASGLVVGRIPGRADRSETPSLQARAAYALPLAHDRAITAGVSMHYGRDEALADENDHDATAEPPTVASYAVALDMEAKLLEWLTLRGEAFVGQDLDGLFVNADVIGTRAVPVIGWWAQLSLRLPPLAAHFGAGLEDPGIPSGARAPAGFATRSRALYFAIATTFGPITIGLELDSLWTRRLESGTARGEQIALACLVQL